MSFFRFVSGKRQILLSRISESPLHFIIKKKAFRWLCSDKYQDVEFKSKIKVEYKYGKKCVGLLFFLFFKKNNDNDYDIFSLFSCWRINYL